MMKNPTFFSTKRIINKSIFIFFPFFKNECLHIELCPCGSETLKNRYFGDFSMLKNRYSIIRQNRKPSEFGPPRSEYQGLDGPLALGSSWSRGVLALRGRRGRWTLLGRTKHHHYPRQFLWRGYSRQTKASDQL